MGRTFHYLGISGSLRTGSYNTMLLHAASNLLPADVTLDIISIADIPVYNPDIDLPTVAARPGSVSAFREAILKADALVIASPEYNYSIPGGLKNAIDWASRGKDSPLLNKPVALMGASTGAWGTVRMQIAFHAVFKALGMKLAPKPEIMVNFAEKKFDEHGNLTDENAKQLIKQLLDGLKHFVD